MTWGINFGGYTMPDEIDLSAWQTPTTTETYDPTEPVVEGDVNVDIFGDSSLANEFDSIDTSGGMGAFGIDFREGVPREIKEYMEDPEAYLEEQQRKAEEAAARKAADTRPEYIKNAPTTYEERQAALKWYIENNVDPTTGFKLHSQKRTELIHRLNGGGQEADKLQWDIQQRLANMTDVEKAQNPQLVQDLQVANTNITNSLIQSAFDAGNKDLTMAVNLSMLAGGIMAGGALGTQIGAATGGSALATGAIKGVTSSILTSGLTGQDIEIKDLITSGVMGAITSGAEALRGMDSEIANGGILGDIDDYVTSVSDLIGVDYDTALSIMEGVAKGTVTGSDIEDVVIGAVGSWSTDQAMDWVKETYGNTFDVNNWFADGSSTIDSEAFRPMVETTIRNGLNGEGMSPEDAVKMAYGYFQNGGNLDFMFPEKPEGDGNFFDWLNLNYDFATPEFIKDLGNTIQGAAEWTYENAIKPAGDVITDAADAVVEAGSDFNREVIKPAVDVIEEEIVDPVYENVVKPAGDVVTDAADWVNEEVIQPGYEAVKDVGHAIDDTIIDPIDEAIRDIDVPTFETPDIEGPDINLDTPDIDLPSLNVDVDLPSFDFNFGSGDGMLSGEDPSGLYVFDPWKAVKPRQVTQVQNYINRGLFK